MMREILLVPHSGRADNLDAAKRAAELLLAAGITVRVCAKADVLPELTHVEHSPDAAAGCELVLVLGGDGTFLRAADLARAVDVPVLGINLGHVGFLAEWDAESLDRALVRVIDRNYGVEDRLTIDVSVFDADGNLLKRGWALNEASIENLDRSGVLDAILEIDGRPVSAFGCDGVLISTPTGSTAYAFSAGGPVLWPSLDAILVVPNNAHALFTKPLVVSPDSQVAVESASDTSAAMVVMDGFRRINMPPGARVEAVRGAHPVRWVRLDDQPFTDRLVRKLRLPIEGWRGRQS
ncbi:MULTISPECIES: NAD kinase [Corynebacterium]|uniref:NAD kinase n=2 Tax=Corynebacterium flavescens TaxID=28028 RepID=A0A1L7CLQ1_CORFL|nr:MULTISPECIES: NAD kinase [Corynebacterium]APT86787.1 inorganic polyphosphate kinase [Corynebacterium flavescens]KAA8721989.1 NAD kinase [Corynebacterium flavescens]MDN6099613.1 NAD kinase [Corynebacterium flavescens]MDN6200104.1 NAD kinase [Corynebacterium flavescens]MDN6226282.1 NAD kinase [Corynebacterium flavescens]